jgi:hypothetical protein
MTDQQIEIPEKAKSSDVTVEVYAPKEIKPEKFTWSRDTLVSTAAAEAAAAFGYQATNPSFKAPNKIVLDRQQTLERAHVHEGEHLELVDAGGGV